MELNWEGEKGEEERGLIGKGRNRGLIGKGREKGEEDN